MVLDARGPRFGAWLTTAVLSAILLTATVSVRAAAWLALGQAVVFAVGAARARLMPYGIVYRLVVRPWLGPPAELEPAGPVRFAQGVGFGFAAVAATALFAGVTPLGVAAAGAALLAAFLNAAFGLCLACKVYPLISLYLVRRPRVRVDAGPTNRLRSTHP